MWLREQNLLSSTANQLRLWANVKSFQSFPFNLTSDVNGILIQHAGRWVNDWLTMHSYAGNMEESKEWKVFCKYTKRMSSEKCLYTYFTLSTAPSYVPILAWQLWKWNNAFKQKNKRNWVDRQNAAWGILTSLVKMFCSTKYMINRKEHNHDNNTLNMVYSQAGSVSF